MTTHRNEDPLCFEKTASRSRNGRIRLVLRRRDARRNGVPPCVSLFGGLCSIRRATSPCVRPSRPWRHNNLHNVSMIASSSVTSRLLYKQYRIASAQQDVPYLLLAWCANQNYLSRPARRQLKWIKVPAAKTLLEYKYIVKNHRTCRLNTHTSYISEREAPRSFRTGGPQKLGPAKPPERLWSIQRPERAAVKFRAALPLHRHTNRSTSQWLDSDQ